MIVEGCAEYIAIKAGARRGFVDEKVEREYVLAEAAQIDAPLTAFETRGRADFVTGTGGEAYTIGWLGCERLTMTTSEDAVAHRFWLSMAKLRDWQKAFAEAFGMTPAEFYRDFEGYRATL